MRDAKSFTSSKVWAKSGDTVTIISINENVISCEGPDGERFPVPAHSLTDLPLPDETENIQLEEPKPDPQPVKKKNITKTTSNKKSIITKQKSLF